MHVKGFTARHPEVPKALRGTYAGLACPAVVEYLRRLGITAVELMPVHQFVADKHLVDRGLHELLGLQLDRLLRPGCALRPDQQGGRPAGRSSSRPW